MSLQVLVIALLAVVHGGLGIDKQSLYEYLNESETLIKTLGSTQIKSTLDDISQWLHQCSTVGCTDCLLDQAHGYVNTYLKPYLNGFNFYETTVIQKYRTAINSIPEGDQKDLDDLKNVLSTLKEQVKSDMQLWVGFMDGPKEVVNQAVQQCLSK